MQFVVFLFFSFFISTSASAKVAACEWDPPGRYPYVLDPVQALKDYSLKPAVRKVLEAKMKARLYDDFMAIDRDKMQSQTHIYSGLRDMHYSRGRMCSGPVTTATWAPQMVQRALIYCAMDGAEEVCIAVPTVCNNVALVDRTPRPITVLPEEATPLVIPPIRDSTPTTLPSSPLMAGPVFDAPRYEETPGSYPGFFYYPGFDSRFIVISPPTAPPPPDSASSAPPAPSPSASGVPSTPEVPPTPTPPLVPPSTPPGQPVTPPEPPSTPPGVPDIPSGPGGPPIMTVPPVIAVPEPSTFLLMLMGFLGLVRIQFKHKARVS